MPTGCRFPKMSLAAPMLCAAWVMQAGASSGQLKTSLTSTRSRPGTKRKPAVDDTRCRTASVTAVATASGALAAGSRPRTDIVTSAALAGWLAPERMAKRPSAKTKDSRSAAFLMTGTMFSQRLPVVNVRREP